MKLLSMTIAKRLWLLAGVAVVSLFVVGITAIVVSGTLSSRLHEVNDRAMPGVKSLLEARNAITSMRALLLMHLAASDDKQRNDIEAQLSTSNKQLLQLITAYAGLAEDKEDRAMLAADEKAVQAYEAVFNEVMKNLKENAKFVARQQIESQAVPLARQVESSLAKHAEFTMAQADRTRASSQRIIIVGNLLSWVLVIAGAALVAFLSFMLIRKIAGDLDKMRNTMRHIESALDFTTRVSIDTQDELGSTARAINRLLDKLQHNLTALAGNINRVASSARDLTQTTTQVALAAGEQSESASSMAASIEQLTVSIHHVESRAGDAEQLSTQSGEMAGAGCKVIAQTVQDIGDISDAVGAASGRIRELEQQGERIAGVVRVIKEVAEQTNMLALNAAIEAARAGEHGRGFAVVADEVRKLAERTTTSTQEISGTIDAMRESARLAVDSMQVAVNRVGAGVGRARDANHAIERIGSGSAETVLMVSEISDAIREQSQASSLIAQQVENIARMADTSNAAAQDGATAARALDQLADEMQQVVVAYRL